MSENTATTENKAPNIKYGFAVLVDETGNVFVEKDPAAFAIPVEREATLIEVRRYLSEILMDLQAQAAAEYSALRIAAFAEEAKKGASAKKS
jgi:hypothetical protein